MGSNEVTRLEGIDAPKLFSLGGRSIIVTGATGGLGFSITKALLQSGADVIAVDRDATPNNPSWDDAQALAAKTGTTLRYYACDIASADHVAAVFEEAVAAARFPLRGLVNCAGVGLIGESLTYPIEKAKITLDVNLLGTFICATTAAKLVRRHGLSASFVLIASMSGYVVQKGICSAAYAASKAGVQQLARAFAAEWGAPQEGPVIRVNSLSPGVIRTPMAAHVLAQEHLEKIWTEEAMLKRISVPEDYRGPAIFLLSDASSYVTAADLLVDGGYTSW